MSLPKPYYDDGNGIVIYNSDCRLILPHLEPVDLLLTDPPYGIGVTRMRLGSRQAKPLYRGSGHWDDEVHDMLPWIALSKDSVIWGGTNFEGIPISRGWLVWDKQNDGTSFADCEMAWTSKNMAARQYRRAWVGAHAKEKVDEDRFHPTQKPVSLMAWCIKFFPDAQTILDPFMGSGTTLRAAKDLGRKAIGIEISREYCDIAIRRLQQETLPLQCEQIENGESSV